MPKSRNRTPIGLSFAAGTLFGAVAVFVPLSSAGHPGVNGAGAKDRLSGAASSPAPASISKPSDAGSKASAPNAAQPESNTASCDVQLD